MYELTSVRVLKISLLCTTKHMFDNKISAAIFYFGGWNVTEIWFCAQNCQLVFAFTGDTVCVKVEWMFPANGLGPEPLGPKP